MNVPPWGRTWGDAAWLMGALADHGEKSYTTVTFEGGVLGGHGWSNAGALDPATGRVTSHWFTK